MRKKRSRMKQVLKVLVLAAGLAVGSLLGCEAAFAAGTTEEVKAAYEKVIEDVDEGNKGKTAGDDLAECDRMYLNVFMRNYRLKQKLEENGFGELGSFSKSLYGKEASSEEELKDWHDNLNSFLVDKGGRYLDPLMSKMKSLSTVEGTFEADEIEFTVSDMDAFLEELDVSAEAFGQIWAVTKMYASETEFQENGFTFSWKSGGDEALNLVAVQTPKTVYTDDETVLFAQRALNAAGCDCGTPDGKAGAKTAAAVEKYKTDHGFANVNAEIDDYLLNSFAGLDAALFSGELSGDAGGASEVYLERDINTIRSNIGSIETSNTLHYSQDVEQDGMKGCMIRVNYRSVFYLLANMEEGVGNRTVCLIPSEVKGEDGANDWVDLASMLVRAIDGSLDGYDAYQVVMNARDGQVEKNGVNYSFGSDYTFYAKY